MTDITEGMRPIKAACGQIVRYITDVDMLWRDLSKERNFNANEHEEICEDCLDVKYGKDRGETTERDRDLYEKVMASVS